MHFRLLKKLTNKQKTIIMPSQIGSRMAFQNAANAVKRAGLNPGNAVLSQSYLRMEVPLVASATSYKFDVLVNESVNGTINTQQKLNLQDAFVANQVGFFLAVPTGSSDTTFRLLTYPAINLSTSQIGTPPTFSVAQAVAANSIYQGQMQLTVNQRTVITAWDLYRHLYIPQVQMNSGYITTAAFAAPASDGSTKGHPFDDHTQGADYGFYPVEPNVVIAGNKKNDLTVVFPAGPSAVPTNSRLVCIWRGILAQNVTPIN